MIRLKDKYLKVIASVNLYLCGNLTRVFKLQKMEDRFRSFLIFTMTFVFSFSFAFAEDFRITGLLKSLTAIDSYGASSIMDMVGDESAMVEERVVGRIMIDTRVADDTTLFIHYENSFSKGEYLSAVDALKGRTASYEMLKKDYPRDSTQLFSLSQEYVDENGQNAYHRLDRFYVSYSSLDTDVRFGRQVLTLGHGKVFNPVDILNPFAPTDVIRDYKNGSDMLSVSSYTKLFSEVLAVVVPRRDADTGQVRYNESSAAVQLKKSVEETELAFMFGGHYGDPFISGGAEASLGEAATRVDGIFAKGSSQSYFSAVANIDYSWLTMDNNTYGFFEIYYNNIGVGSIGQIEQGSELSERLERGDIYLRDRFYTAIGLQYEVHPLINLHASVIYNINDTSFIFQPRVVWDFRENMSITAGVDLPEGDLSSEFGGFTDVSTGRVIAPAKRAYGQINLYF